MGPRVLVGSPGLTELSVGVALYHRTCARPVAELSCSTRATRNDVPLNGTDVVISQSKGSPLSRPRAGAIFVLCVIIAGTLMLAGPVAAASSAPTISKLEPAFGPGAGGTTVTITGSNFKEVTAVKFGSSDATSVKVESETTITAVSPPGKGTLEVIVEAQGGVSASTFAAMFDYAPTVTSVTPYHGPPSGGTEVTITGTNFTGSPDVYFGASASTNVKRVSDTEIIAVAPPFRGGRDDAVGVFVLTEGGSNEYEQCDTERVDFVYEPTISKVEPKAGPAAGGTEVTIVGGAFKGAIFFKIPLCTFEVPVVKTVWFGSREATNLNILAQEEMTAVAPPGTGTVNVTIENAMGTSSPVTSSTQFTYAPTVSQVEPDLSPATGGTPVTIIGTGFTGATAVKFGATSATSFNVESETKMTVVSPPGAGTVDVRVSTPAGTSPTSPADQVSYGPAVTQVEPDRGPTAGGTPVVITGTGFIGATAVKFGSTNATSFTVSSADSITAISPPGAGTVNVTVSTAAGTSAENVADEFSYEAVALEEAPLTTSGAPGTSGPSGGGAHDGSLAGTVNNAFGLIGIENFMGKLKLTVDLPGPGTLEMVAEGNTTTSRDVKSHSKSGHVTMRIAQRLLTVAKAGKVVVALTPSGKAKRMLARQGKLKATVTITYTPKGGEPRSATRIVTLRLRH